MIVVDNLNVSYFGNLVLNNINFELPLEKSIGIIGPNGAGKTTLLKSALGIIKKDSGVVTINGTDISKMKKNIAYVSQRSDIDLSFPITVFDTVLTGTYPNLKLFSRPGKNEKKIVKDCLDQVGMQEFSDKQIGELSGGQLQRVFIARALAQDADFLFLDEPFAGIDMVSEKIIIDILHKARNNGKTIITVHHDLHKVVEYFDHLIIVNKKLIVCDETKKAFINKYIQEAYGDSMGDVKIKGVDG